MKKLLSFLLVILAISNPLVGQDRAQLIQELKEHVFTSIDMAQQGVSKLPFEVMTIHGASSPHVRHLLNNLCGRPGTRYLEIGCYKGSTCVSALYGNNANVEDAVAIDMWGEQVGIKEIFLANVAYFIPTAPLRVYQSDCFKVDLKKTFSQPVNLYFYDGDHSFEAHKAAFTAFDSILDDVFIAVIDDWNWEQVRQGSYQAFKELGYQVLLEIPLFTGANCSTDSWWNGIFIAIIQKSS